MVTGLLYPSVVIAVSVVTDVLSLLSGGELEPGSSVWSGELSLGGLWSAVDGVLMGMGPGLLAAATLRVAPIRFAGMSGWVVPSDPTDAADRPAPVDLPGVQVRPARADDGERLREIERRAGERFREVDLSAIADDEPMTVDQLAEYAADGRSFVATLDVDGPGTDLVVGYVVVELVDGNAHIEQISVDPAVQGKGVGRALLERVEQFARSRSSATLTLTTFRDVPWNAPLYEHLGFRVLRDDELGPELIALIADEAAHGLDPEQRGAMARPVDVHVGEQPAVKDLVDPADTSTGARSSRS